jgi:dihydrolipoamide dehydrogenase
MTIPEAYDLIIIGAGPGGYTAAIRASQLGLKVCVIEKDRPGGVCLNWGCIPTKNIIHQAEIFHSRSELEEMGVSVDVRKFDFSCVFEKSRAAVNRLVKGVEYLLKKNNVMLIKGTAKIVNKNSIVLEDDTRIIAKNILIATGSRPMQLPGFETDEKQVLSSFGILSLKKLPKSLIILGGGAIGCEFAFIMNAFGVKVYLVEMMDHILPFEDHETAAVLEKSFKKKEISVMTGTRAISLKKSSKKVLVNLQVPGSGQKQIESQKILCVFGRTPNTDGIGLENIGLKTEKGYIPVGDYGQTPVKGVFAIGDVVATPLLAHVASKEAEIAVEYMAGHQAEARIDPDAIPSAIYCQPQVAGFGLREDRAREQNIPYKKALFPYQAMGKAVAIGQAEGLIKVLCDPNTTEILGAHIIGYNATELIHEILLAKTTELIPEDIAKMIHAHPTLSEGIMEGMREVEGHAIHI